MAGEDLPVTKQGAVLIDGIHTDIVCTAFSDKIFVAITQYEKLGTIIHVIPDNGPADTQQQSFTTKVLFGKDEPITYVMAKNLAMKICEAPSSKPLLLALALKEHSPTLLKTLQDVIVQYRVW